MQKRDRLHVETRRATEPSYEFPKERRRSQGNEGAALEGGSEHINDTGVQGR